MSEAEYLKCACKECGNNIEFPPSAARTTITCPHCGEWTELVVAEEEEESGGPGIRVNLMAVIGCAVLLVVCIGGGIWFVKHKKTVLAENSDTATPNKVEAITPVKPPTAIHSNTVPPAATQAAPATNSEPPPPPKPTRPKSPDDLKVGAVQMEKTKGSSLVYAVGTLKNDSDYDRYGIRVELDLFDAKGTKIGIAKDYKDYLGPRQDWQFRALIPNLKTVEAKLATVKEDQ